MPTLGSRIRDLRIHKGLTETELGEGLVTPSMISQIESDRANPSYKLLIQLAERLDTTVDYLLSDNLQFKKSIAVYNLAKGLYHGKDYTSAIRLYEQLIETSNFPVSKPQIMYEYSECLLADSKPDQVIEIIDQTLKPMHENDQPDRFLLSRLYYCKGKAYAMKHNILEAHWNLQKALDIYYQEDQRDSMYLAEVLLHLAKCFRFISKDSYETYLTRALTEYRKCKSSEDMGEVYLELARTSEEKTQYESAVVYVEKAIAAYLSKGFLDEFKDSEHKAIMLKRHQTTPEATIEKLLAIVEYYGNREKKKRAALLLDIAELYLETRDYEQAKTYIESAQSLLTHLDSLSGKAYHLIGSLHKSLHESEPAKKYLERAVHIYSQHRCLQALDDATNQLADCLEQDKQYREALTLTRSYSKFLVKELNKRGVWL